LVTCEESLFFN